MRLLLFFLSLFISVSLQASIIKVINNSDKPIFVTVQKFGCLGICSTEHPGFNATINKTHFCCLDKKQGQPAGTPGTLKETSTSKAISLLKPESTPMYTVTPKNLPGWYILPGQSEEENFSRNNYTFYAYQQDSSIEWVNNHANKGMILSFPGDFTQN